MWWLDPGKEVLQVVFNRILAPYVENLDLNQVNYGIAQGQLTLRNLRLKKGALDKFRLPVDVVHGHLGKFSISLHWLNLGNKPAKILIEDIYLLVVPSPKTNEDLEEEENRVQAAKQERLENAELLQMRTQIETSDSAQSQGLWQSLLAKIINNLQVTVRNIHIRYEDPLSVMGRPFATGLTLRGFTAFSVNEEWEPAFIESTAGAIHKLANLESLAIYFDTDTASMAGLSLTEVVQQFSEMISHKDVIGHQFILKPVSGEGRIVMNNKIDKETPRFDIQLIFDEIAIALDDEQYRDSLSLLDMFHVHIRQRQYRKFWPSEYPTNLAKTRLLFAGRAILDGIHEHSKRWTWAYFAERRDDRLRYIDLFGKKLLSILLPEEEQELDVLDRKLSYEDIRFYRSIARSHLRKDQALQKKLGSEQTPEPSKQGWGTWLMQSFSSAKPEEDVTFGKPITEEQKKELYDVLDYDERAAVAESFETPREFPRTRIAAKLQQGSFALKKNSQGTFQDVISVIFDVFQAKFVQRRDSIEVSVSLGGFGVFDGITQGSLHRQIVRVKDKEAQCRIVEENATAPDDPFFFISFENNPLDGRADSALTVRMRHMEIIYYKGYVESIYRFFKPPASHLESVEALLNVASRTLEGLRKETRAGLEYALQSHKTIDLHVDMNAPVIIIPEDVTIRDCTHLIVDAGHISIESNLADKEAIRSIRSKRNQKYADADYKHLESLMYDKLALKLGAAQFIIGTGLQACLAALSPSSNDALHVLERINVDLELQSCIVSTVPNLPRFKISGKLPSLNVNFSDSKYKSILRLIDTCLPNFEDKEEMHVTSSSTQHSGVDFQLSPTIFGQQPVSEYNVVSGESADDDQEDSEDLFFEADDGSSITQPLQHTFELDFQVDTLKASLFKSSAQGEEMPFGDVLFRRFALFLSLTQYDMNVDVQLRSLSMDLVQKKTEVRLPFISSANPGTGEDGDLLTVAYTRVQADAPDFASIYEGINQSVDIKISTFKFCVAPEPVISLYDFLVTTFASPTGQQPTLTGSAQTRGPVSRMPPKAPVEEQKIRVLVKLARVQVTLLRNETESIATLSLSVADVSVLLRPRTMRVSGLLGSLAFSNDNRLYAFREEFNQILSIQGQNLAEFRYQTFDSSEESYNGINSSVYLKAASLKFTFLKEPLRDIYQFLNKLARLKGLYDAATQAAVQTASTIEVGRMQFEVSIQTPILVFPFDPLCRRDVLVMELGEMSAKNKPEATMNKTTASLSGVRLVSTLYKDGKGTDLNMIENIDISAEVTQAFKIDRTNNITRPDNQTSVAISDIKLHLTEPQYQFLIQILQSIPEVLTTASDTDGHSPGILTNATFPNEQSGPIIVTPVVRMASAGEGSRAWPTLDLLVFVKAVQLHLYDRGATTQFSLSEHGIAGFALNDNKLRFKMLSDGSSEAEIVLRSFTMNNTRPGASRFRELIPAAHHDRNQFMLLYSMSGGPTGTGLAVLTVDAPQMIFAIEPVVAVIEFFGSASAANQQPVGLGDSHSGKELTGTETGELNFRIELHDLSVTVLADDEDADSQAIKLSVQHILVSQQGVLALSLERLGMSLMRMGRPSESVRFLDDVDLTFSLDSRSSSSQQLTSIELAVKPIVFRASRGDVNLILVIVNKALESYKNTQKTPSTEKNMTSSSQERASSASVVTPRAAVALGSARALMSKQQLTGSFDGLRVVLIGDLFEQPMLHLKFKPFTIGAKDWTGQLHANATIAMQINYWNMSNSHWEPLIDPWTFTIAISNEELNGGQNITLSARERLDLNITVAFAEMVLSTMKHWTNEVQAVVQKPRGAYAPYRIRNRTGIPIFIWSDVEGDDPKEQAVVKVLRDQTVDWRFDNWKTIREHVSSSQHSIGIQFVGREWEKLKGIPVDREGEYIYSLRPRTNYPNRVLCEVKVVDTVKVVTVRSTYQVENLTLYPLEVMLVDDAGHPTHSLEKVSPGQDYAVPLEAVMKYKIRIQPDQGFGYKWCSPIRWEELIAKKSFTIRCLHANPTEAAFRFQAWVQADAPDAVSRRFPKIHLKLRAPLELENLLPYNLEYRIYDKDADQNWRSYLRKGGLMPVHSVELAHFVLLNVTVQETVFPPSDFAIINTDGNSEFEIENRLVLQDSRNRTLRLKLNYIRYPESGGAFKVQIYCPYIFINKTGTPVHIKSTRSTRAGSQDVAGDTRPDAQPHPFLLSHAQENGHEFLFRVGDSAWSKILSIEAPTADAALVIPSQLSKSEEYHVGLSWSEGLGKHRLTKVLVMTPRFLIKNNLEETMSFREHGFPPRDGSVIDPRERRPLQILRTTAEKLLTIAYPGLNAQWSAPINIEDIGAIHFRLLREQNSVQLIQADVKVDGSIIFIYFSLAKYWPFVIENDSDYVLTLQQKDSESDNKGSSKKPYPRYVVQPRATMNYAWDFPAVRDKKIMFTINGSRRVVDILEIGTLMPFKFNVNNRTRAVSLDVRAEDYQQILRISNYQVDRSVYKPRSQAISSSVSRQDSISTTSSVDAFEAATINAPPTLTFDIDFAGIGISLVNKRMVEVIYGTMTALKIEYSNSPVAQTFNLSCGSLQVDNQLHDATYPVILQPTPIPKERSGVAAPPTVQASVIWLNDEEHGVLFVKYCSILLQALTIEADEDLLFAVYDLSQIPGATWEQGAEDLLLQDIDKISEPSDNASGSVLYFEVLELQPIRLSLSFVRSERTNSEEKLSLRNPLAVVLNALTMTVGNINDASIELNALGIKDIRLTLPELQSRIVYHYRQDVLRQLYLILGSADFIGNPVGLFTNVSSGVADIFYEPLHGVVMHGNKELGIGIAKGAASFVKKTVFGLSDSVTKFTSSVGKGLSAATFDPEYQARRRLAQRRNKPRHAIYGVAAGGEALANSVTSAMEGVLMKPIEGAEMGGALGFFKGVGKGLVGVVTKPVIGVFDLASNVSEGIRNTTTVFDNPDLDRVRSPRLTPSDGVLRPYLAREALGQYWMRDLNSGAYRQDFYVAHISSMRDDNVILLTVSRVLSFWSKNLRLEWELPFADVQGVTIEDTGIRFAHKAGKEHDRFAFVPDKGSQSWFFSQVGSVVKAFNAKKRMDI